MRVSPTDWRHDDMCLLYYLTLDTGGDADTELCFN